VNRWTCAAFLLPTLVLASEPVGLSVDEFKMYRHYLNALEDSRVQAMKPDARLPAIAKDAKFDLKKLKATVAKGEAAGDLKAKCEANLKEVLDATDLKPRILKVEVDASEPHAVAYIQWSNEAQEKLSYEASVIAGTAGPSCSILSSIQVWAQDAANPKRRVFQALISSSSAGRIDPVKAKDFAETRYVRLFEKLKSVANGDDLSAETGATPAAKP